MDGGLVLQAFLVALAYFICFGGNWLIGQNMAEQPIVVGPLVGLFLGDLQTGLILGASLQAVFMGAVNVGGAIALSPVFGTALSVAFAILTGGGEEIALVLSVPLGLLGGMLEIFGNTFTSLFNNTWQEAAKTGDDKKVIRLHYGAWFIKYLFYSIVVFIAVLAGSSVVTTFVENIPEFLTNGLGVVAGLLPGVGFAQLLSMIWSKEIGIFYFIGFIMFVYLELPLVAIAIIGLGIALTVGTIEHRILTTTNANSIIESDSDSLSEEEDFLS